MSSGIYSSYSGAAANLADVEILSNNLANVDTAGFRRDQARFDTVLGPLVDFARRPESRIDVSPGTQKLDKNPLHAAIDGPGFFVVQAPDGSERYTRRGDFQVTPAGDLVLPDGSRVLGTGGGLTIPPGTTAELRGDGSLATPDGVVGKLRIVEFAAPELVEKVGDSTVAATPEAGLRDAQNARIAPGFVESSNVNIASEMVTLIIAQRSFEANMNALRINDEMTEKVVDAQR
jgi:flagellar basal-body rod protein FlgF